jgi:hypothetical protein
VNTYVGVIETGDTDMTAYELQTATTVELEATLALVEYSRIERQRLMGVAIINELARRASTRR